MSRGRRRTKVWRDGTDKSRVRTFGVIIHAGARASRASRVSGNPNVLFGRRELLFNVNDLPASGTTLTPWKLRVIQFTRFWIPPWNSDRTHVLQIDRTDFDDETMTIIIHPLRADKFVRRAWPVCHYIVYNRMCTDFFFSRRKRTRPSTK